MKQPYNPNALMQAIQSLGRSNAQPGGAQLQPLQAPQFPTPRKQPALNVKGVFNAAADNLNRQAENRRKDAKHADEMAFRERTADRLDSAADREALRFKHEEEDRRKEVIFGKSYAEEIKKSPISTDPVKAEAELNDRKARAIASGTDVGMKAAGNIDKRIQALRQSPGYKAAQRTQLVTGEDGDVLTPYQKRVFALTGSVPKPTAGEKPVMTYKSGNKVVQVMADGSSRLVETPAGLENEKSSKIGKDGIAYYVDGEGRVTGINHELTEQSRKLTALHKGADFKFEQVEKFKTELRESQMKFQQMAQGTEKRVWLINQIKDKVRRNPDMLNEVAAVWGKIVNNSDAGEVKNMLKTIGLEVGLDTLQIVNLAPVSNTEFEAAQGYQGSLHPAQKAKNLMWTLDNIEHAAMIQYYEQAYDRYYKESIIAGKTPEGTDKWKGGIVDQTRNKSNAFMERIRVLREAERAEQARKDAAVTWERGAQAVEGKPVLNGIDDYRKRIQRDIRRERGYRKPE